jgi:TATA-box binding protein (TBP) (component of TFIID and TFIIIB)
MTIQNCTITFSLGHRFSQREYLWLARNGWNLEYNPQRFHAIIMRLRHHYHNNENDANALPSATVTALVFSSGRVVMTGLRRPDMAENVAWLVCRQLQRTALMDGGDEEPAATFGPRLQVREVCVRNIVGACTVNIISQWQQPDPPRLKLHTIAAALLQSARHRAPASSIALCSTGMGDNEEADDYNADNIIIRPLRVEYDATMFPAVRCRFELINNNNPHEHEDDEETQPPTAGTCLIFTSGKFIVTGIRTTANLERAIDGWDKLFTTYPNNEEMLKYIIFP